MPKENSDEAKESRSLEEQKKINSSIVEQLFATLSDTWQTI
ncbi:MAG: hypothetical protein R3B41_01625 [Candidatus Doudnabacteria bacterium]